MFRVFVFLFLLSRAGAWVKEQSRTIKQRASAVTRAHCCEDVCILSGLSYEKGLDAVYKTINDREGMTRTENKNDLREKIMVSFYDVLHLIDVYSCIVNYFLGVH